MIYNWYKIIKISSFLGMQYLLNEAKKHSSFEDFKNYYLLEIHHGLYWHITSNPDFKIDLDKSPRDMSSLSINPEFGNKGLMITSDLEHWHYYYNFDEDENPYIDMPRPYAALLDLSNLSPFMYKQIKRGFGNEMFLDASIIPNVKIINIYPIEEALKIDKEYHELLPSNEKELQKIYELSKEEK